MLGSLIFSFVCGNYEGGTGYNMPEVKKWDETENRQTHFMFYMKQQRKRRILILSECHLPLFPFGSFSRKSRLLCSSVLQLKFSILMGNYVNRIWGLEIVGSKKQSDRKDLNNTMFCTNVSYCIFILLLMIILNTLSFTFVTYFYYFHILSLYI